MNTRPRIIFTVTNDLRYDQRMHRICGTLDDAGYEVWLTGRRLPGSQPLPERPFRQIRLTCWARKGFLFYAEFNVRLFFFLLFSRFDAVGTVDLDTMPAGALAAWLKNKQRVFDAHEYFTEVPEVVNRPVVKGFWKKTERLFLPFYRHAYTVGPALADLFSQQHGIPFAVVRNVPVRPLSPLPDHKGPVKKLFYQGALNEGRGIEALLEAMTLLPDHFHLYLAGEGDLSETLRLQASHLNLAHKVTFLGFVTPENLKAWTAGAWLGFNLLENKGLSYYYSLANKFFDYLQADVPVVTMDFPEYRALNNVHEVAVLLPGLEAQHIAAVVLRLDNNPEMYQYLVRNCQKAAAEWHWDNEKITLLAVWQQALPLNASST